MTKTTRRPDVPVTGTNPAAEQQLRRVARAIIALARAKLEAEAQAVHEGQQADRPPADSSPASNIEAKPRRAS